MSMQTNNEAIKGNIQYMNEYYMTVLVQRTRFQNVRNKYYQYLYKFCNNYGPYVA